jgi:hypothetical protein
VAIERGSTNRSNPSHGLVAATALEPCFQAPRTYPVINDEVQTYIVDLFTEGHSLRKIAAMEGSPTEAQIYRLYRDNEVFRERIQKARITRALQAEEAIEELGETAASLGKDDVPGARLAFDIHRFRAEVNDPATYGKKQTIQGDMQRPIVFQFVSHIPEQEPAPKLPDIEVTPIPEEGTNDEDPE